MSDDHNEPLPEEALLDRLLTMSADPPKLGPEARDRLLARIERSRTEEVVSATKPAHHKVLAMTPPPPRSLKLPAYIFAIAATGVLVWGGFQIFGHTTAPGDLPRDADQISELHGEDGRPRRVVLADGSTAILRKDTLVRVLGPRQLELVRGEVLLEVVPGSTEFRVATAAGAVQVHGTKFVLRQDASGSLLAGVLRGELSLLGAGEALALKAGQAADWSQGQAPVARPAVRLSHEVRWARDAMQDPLPSGKAVRRGNLLARFPTWPGEWPLPVRVMDVDVYIEDGVARTTIDQTFFNHTNFELEGVYSFPLPADAAISRLAMYVDGKRMEAGVTERQEGREIYESIVYRRRDPALLEWMQGNEFRMRVFPLPARTEKRILLSYTQALPGLYGATSVRVPIPELDLPVDTLRYRVHLRDQALAFDACCVNFTVEDTPDGRIAAATLHNIPVGDDLSFSLYPKAPPPVVTAATMADPGGDYLMVRARPTFKQLVSTHQPRRWVILHDTSASRSPAELTAQTNFLRYLLQELDEGDRFTLLAFDSTVRALPGGFTRVDAVDRAALEGFLVREGRDHVGASNLGLAVDQALGLLDADAGSEAPHILYLGDGILSSPGDAPRTALRERLTGRATFVGIGVGDEQDPELLTDLSSRTSGLYVQIHPGAELRWQALDLVAALGAARVHNLQARLLGPGDQPLAGQTHASAQFVADGEEVVVLSRSPAKSDAKATTLVLEGTLAGEAWSQRFELPPAKTDAGYVPRLWARAQVAADVRAGAEDKREQIVALGLEHFLVTPFTSLLVLENEAMYRQFKVKRPSTTGWAHYAAPDEITVVRETIATAQAAPGQTVARQPVAVVHSEQADLGFSGRHQQFMGGGLGLVGTGRGGGGTGEGTIGLGMTGLIGKGGGGGTGSGYGRGAGAGFGGRGTRVPTVRMEAASFGPSLDLVAVPTSPQAQQVVTRRSLTDSSTAWNRDDVTEPDVAKELGASDFVSSFAEARPGRHRGGNHYPQAFNHLQDTRLGDLSEHLPALFEDAFDREREQLLTASLANPDGQVSPQAEALLRQARAKLATTTYEVGGGVLRVEAGGTFTRVRRIGGYLPEVVHYDGSELTATYPEQDLQVVRRVGAAEPALLSHWVPWLLPAPETLAQWYKVDLQGPRTLRLQQLGSEDTLELQLDEALRLVAISRHRGTTVIGETRFDYSDDGVTISRGGTTTQVRATTVPLEIPSSDAATTRLELPLRSDADLAAAQAEHTPGDAAWRALHRQRLAVAAALGQQQQLAPLLIELLPHGTLHRGELVLASGGVLIADNKVATKLLAARPGDPVVAYLEAVRLARRNQLTRLDAVVREHKGQLTGMLASHVRILAETSKGVTPAALQRLREFLGTYAAEDLHFVATHALASGRYDWANPAAMVPAWQALADASPQWRSHALYQAAIGHQRARQWSQASESMAKSLAAAVDLKQIPAFDWNLSYALQRGGSVGWRAQWQRWRAVVQDSGDASQFLAFITVAQMIGEVHELDRLFAGADLKQLDPSSAARLAMQLIELGRLSEAETVLQPLLRDAGQQANVLALGASLAERRGDMAEAAALAERALAEHTQLPLQQLRITYQAIFDLRARLATQARMAGDDDPRDPLDRALDVAARWRAEDPDNADIDERCAALLFTLNLPEEAQRHLDSIVERRPAEGEAHARVAKFLEREGLFEVADEYWQHAIAVEPTNPTWRIDRAHNRYYSGDVALARTLVEEVLGGSWQDRFWAVPEDAKDLKKRLDTSKPAQE